MMNLAMTRKPMHPRLQAILDPKRLLPTPEESERTKGELASRLGVMSWHAKQRKAKQPTRKNWVGGDFVTRRRPSRSTLSDAKRQKIIELFESDQWPSLRWICEQVGASKTQVDHLLESTGRRQPAAGPREAALESVQRAMRFRPEGHLAGQELVVMLGLNPKTLSTRLGRAKITGKRIASVCFYAEGELRKAGILK